MVLFKLRFSSDSNTPDIIYIPIWFYSNENGNENISIIGGNIYIPIWFYSNLPGIVISEISLSFTFQYGSIQIK